jgi:hypothetical protein
MKELVRRGRRALGLPPAYVARRLYEEAVKSTRRPWSHVRPHLLTEGKLLEMAGASSVGEWWQRQLREPFFLDQSRRETIATAFRTQYPALVPEIVARADRVLAHEFDLLGSGPKVLGERLPWHEDFKTGRCWMPQYWRTFEYNELDRPTDVKVPWELSRCQHFTVLGQAYWLTGDERYAREFVAQVSDWLEANPWSHSINWACPMDVALRAMSWIWAFHFFGSSPACANASFQVEFLKALYLHAEFVADNLERYAINGNHYLTDGVGLVFLGAFFRRLPAGRQWLETGREIVVDEIFTQVTEDGVDYEMSTAYHRLVLEGFSTAYVLLRTIGERVGSDAWSRLERMCEFVDAYVKPDGTIPLIGDADDGRMQQLGTQPINEHRYLLSTAAVLFSRPDFKASAGRCWDETFWLLGPEATTAFAALPDMPRDSSSRAFHAGGYFVLRAPGAHVIIDCGEVGMLGVGGHGHNDITSFELFLNGINIVTDCGAYLYTASREWRNRFRSTSFHNVVQVDDEEINRFISPDLLWTLRYDGKPVDRHWVTTAELDRFSGSHTGYERLEGRVRPRRTVILDRRHLRVVVHDELTGEGKHHLHWRFHLDPDLEVHVSDGDVRARKANREVWLLPLDRGELDLSVGWVSPSYGIKRQTAVISSPVSARLPVSRTWLFADERVPRAERAAYVQHVITNSFHHASDPSQ